MLMSVTLRQDLFAMDRLMEEGEVDAAINVVSETKERQKKKAKQNGGEKKRTMLSGLKKRRRVLALVDEDERYLGRLDGYLTEHLGIPFEICEYTSVETLLASREKKEPTILVIAGNLYRELMAKEETPFEDVIVLEDPEDVVYEEDLVMAQEGKVSRIDKFTSSDRIVSAVLDHCLSCSQVIATGNGSRESLTVYGVYSPLTRCLQSTCAATLAQLLGKDGKTLYITFEPFASLRELQSLQAEYDLSDFLYFFECYPGKTPLYLEKVKKTVGSMDVIAPARNYLSLKGTQAEKWEELFQQIAAGTDYEYVVLDLHENMDAHLGLLGLCDTVFTMTREDPVSQGRQAQYEELLKANGMEKILHATTTLTLPLFEKLPAQIRMLPQSELTPFVEGALHEASAAREGMLA